MDGPAIFQLTQKHRFLGTPFFLFGFVTSACIKQRGGLSLVLEENPHGRAHLSLFESYPNPQVFLIQERS
jgi:hypothetical protein